MRPFLVNREYLRWAHEAAAEDGHPPAALIMTEVELQRGLNIAFHTVPLVAEIEDVADLHAIRDGSPATERTARRVRDRARAWLAAAKREGRP